MTKIKDTHAALVSLPDIQEICKPLVEILGVTGFCYHKILRNGQEIMLSNSQKWTSRVFENNLDKYFR